MFQKYGMFLTRSLREPGGPCTKSMEVSESRMERVNDLFAKRGKRKYPSYFLKGMNKVTDNQQIANEFNSYFSSVATKLKSEHIQGPVS